MADRLVQLERRAARRRGSASCARRGQAGRAEQRDRLLGHARRVRPAARAPGSARSPPAPRRRRARRGRSGPGVSSPADRHGRDPAAALGDALLAERALGRREQPSRSRNAWKCALRERSRAGRRAGRVGREQHGELVLERDRERVALAGLAHSPARGRLGGERRGARGAAAPRAIASARSSAASASARSVPRVAAKPQAPPTRTRTPMPSLSCESSSSTRPLRVESRSTRERTWRASA